MLPTRQEHPPFESFVEPRVLVSAPPLDEGALAPVPPWPAEPLFAMSAPPLDEGALAPVPPWPAGPLSVALVEPPAPPALVVALPPEPAAPLAASGTPVDPEGASPGAPASATTGTGRGLSRIGPICST